MSIFIGWSVVARHNYQLLTQLDVISSAFVMSMRFYKLGHMGVFSMKSIYNIQTIVHSYQLTWFHLLCLKREIKGLSASYNSQVIWKT